MAQELRLTFEHKDYTFRILSGPVSRETAEIQIMVEGGTRTLIREAQQRVPKENAEAFSNRLPIAIGKAISLRYRI